MMNVRWFTADFFGETVRLTTYDVPDGKVRLVCRLRGRRVALSRAAQ
jgi:hypothetical protein